MLKGEPLLFLDLQLWDTTVTLSRPGTHNRVLSHRNRTTGPALTAASTTKLEGLPSASSPISVHLYGAGPTFLPSHPGPRRQAFLCGLYTQTSLPKPHPPFLPALSKHTSRLCLTLLPSSGKPFPPHKATNIQPSMSETLPAC